MAVAADLFRFAGFPKEATQFYKFAQNMDEQETWSYKGAAMALLDANNLDEAYKSFQQAFELEKDLESNENDHI